MNPYQSPAVDTSPEPNPPSAWQPTLLAAAVITGVAGQLTGSLYAILAAALLAVASLAGYVIESLPSRRS